MSAQFKRLAFLPNKVTLISWAKFEGRVFRFYHAVAPFEDGKDYICIQFDAVPYEVYVLFLAPVIRAIIEDMTDAEHSDSIAVSP